MSDLKIGDVVQVITLNPPPFNDTYVGEESERWIKEDKLELNKEYTITQISPNNDVKVSKYGYWHSQHIFKKVNMERKIIGYKAPADIADGVPKGTLYGNYKDMPPLLFVPLEGSCKNDNFYSVPKQLIEATWEPVYGDVKTLEINGVTTNFENGIINFVSGSNKGGFRLSQLQDLYMNLIIPRKVGLFNVTIKSIHIGCDEGVDFTPEDINKVINYYKS